MPAKPPPRVPRVPPVIKDSGDRTVFSTGMVEIISQPIERVITFRGKALGDGHNFKAGEFVYGSLVFEGDEPYIVGPVVEANEDYIALEWWVLVDPASVEQCVPNTEKEALVQQIARLKKHKRLVGNVIRKLQVRVNQLEEVLEDYLELSETGQLCSIRCDADNNHCDTCDIVYLENRIKELLGKEAD